MSSHMTRTSSRLKEKNGTKPTNTMTKNNDPKQQKLQVTKKSAHNTSNNNNNQQEERERNKKRNGAHNHKDSQTSASYNNREREEETSQTNDRMDNSDSPPTKRSNSEWKEVNSSSRHRRGCKRIEDDQDINNQTPERGNSTLKSHSFVTRVTLKLSVPASTTPETSLISIWKECIEELQMADDSIHIYPWAQRNDRVVTRIKDPKNFNPTNIREVKPYASRFYTYDNTNKMVLYPNIRIGHDKGLDEIREEMKDWTFRGKHGIFENMLQAESSTEIGWLLYSTREMDTGALADEIADELGLNIGLRWKVIATGGKGKLSNDQKINALSVEVESGHRYMSQRKMLKYLGRTTGKEVREFPNGIRLRFVKPVSDAINPTERGKLEKLRARQKAFTASIKTCETRDIIQLDYKPDEVPITLRQMIMDIKSAEFKDTSLFHMVDLDWKQDAYIFQFSPKLQAEAECMIHTLLPYLQGVYNNNDIEFFFSAQCQDRCLDMVYDHERGRVVDQDDESLQDENFEEEDKFLGFDLTIVHQEEEAKMHRPEKDKLAPSPTDDDSVSTLGAPLSARKAAPNNQGFNPQTQSRHQRTLQHPNSDDRTVNSQSSSVTMESIATIESRLDQLAQAVSNNDDKFRLILDRLDASNRTAAQKDTSNAAQKSSEAGGGNDSSGKVS